MAKDYYAALGVSKNASDEDLKKAYRKLAHKWHPDKQGGDEAKFKEINEAYQVLSDKNKRAQYDQFGDSFASGGGGGKGFGGFDFGRGFEGFSNGNFRFENSGGFEDIFSEIFGGGRSSHQGMRHRGSDIPVDVEISFEEMAAGVKKTISVRRTVECSMCKGSGGKKGSREINCSTCGGSGRVKRAVRSVFGAFQQVEECDTCHGSGKTWHEKCSECRGSGRMKELKEFTIDIPAGIADGQALALSGGGEAGERGASAGDLIITVHIRPHALFKRRGNDIVSSIEISFARAVLGDSVSVKTIDGEMTIKIPPGTQSGEVFRIRNKGLRSIESSWGGRGDHLFTVSVLVPKRISRDERKLLEKLRELE